MAKGGCSKEQPPFLTNETEKGRGAICLTVQDAMSVVAVGTGKYAEVMARFDG